ncbi:hypothetical protein ESZ50_09085 [Weissella muntiaci]|uniref:Uncharacterized protein n=1 Tax=Weissella muntiaci TaxID=2508881 RepID=A0A6C2C4Z9_9LACO|nr:hypothetical protein [Weissella muntiaci]TYC48355.1 hypothetical protein ESZ50_09085 [Weissella muntiaci]
MATTQRKKYDEFLDLSNEIVTDVFDVSEREKQMSREGQDGRLNGIDIAEIENILSAGTSNFSLRREQDSTEVTEDDITESTDKVEEEHDDSNRVVTHDDEESTTDESETVTKFEETESTVVKEKDNLAPMKAASQEFISESPKTAESMSEGSANQIDLDQSLSELEAVADNIDETVPDQMPILDTTKNDHQVELAGSDGNENSTSINVLLAEQLNRVVTQNNLMIAQVDQLQKYNDELYRKNNKWQEYRNEATVYIHNTNEKYEQIIKDLKNSHAQELDTIENEWAKQFEDKSTEVEKRYMDFEQKTKSITDAGRKERISLEARIKTLQDNEAQLRQKYDDEKINRQHLETRLRNAEQEIANFDEEHGRIEETSNKNLVKVQQQTEQVDLLNERIRTLIEQNKAWEHQVDELKQKSIDDFKNTRNQMDQIIADLTDKNAALDAQKQTLENKYAAVLQRTRSLEYTTRNLQEQNNDLIKRVKQNDDQDLKLDADGVPDFNNDFPFSTQDRSDK